MSFAAIFRTTLALWTFPAPDQMSDWKGKRPQKADKGHIKIKVAVVHIKQIGKLSDPVLIDIQENVGLRDPFPR